MSSPGSVNVHVALEKGIGKTLGDWPVQFYGSISLDLTAAWDPLSEIFGTKRFSDFVIFWIFGP
jgi:hypothetical protein